MKSQYEVIGSLLARRKGCTSMDIIRVAGTVSPHSRLAELKARGWSVRSVQVPGRSHRRYYGTAPRG